MKKWISVVLATFCTVGFVEAATLEEMNKNISEAKNPTSKQVMICEREANFINKDPQQCTKAVDMLLEMSKKSTKTSLLRCEYFGASEALCKTVDSLYKTTDKEFFNESIVGSYLNTGVVYHKNMMYEKSFTMFKKAIEYDPNKTSAHLFVGIGYYFGQGVAMNKNKAYEHWRIAAKQGDQQAQENLDTLCAESPWACK